MDAGKWIQERVVMSREYAWLCQKLLGYLRITDDSGLFWEMAQQEIEIFQHKYSAGYVKEMMLELLYFLEDQEKELAQEKQKLSLELSSNAKRLLDDAIKMQEKVRRDSGLKKVYSDVPFGQLIRDIEDYQEQLKTAERLFG